MFGIIISRYDQQLDEMRMEHDPLYTFKATAHPDTMYMHKAMSELDWNKFLEEMSNHIGSRQGSSQLRWVKAKECITIKHIHP